MPQVADLKISDGALIESIEQNQLRLMKVPHVITPPHLHRSAC
jgi:hypothetical protein